MENRFISVMRIWAALVWADRLITREEDAAMRRLIARAELSEPERATALGFLERKVTVEAAGVNGLTEEERLAVYRAAVMLSAVDNHIAEEEIDFLGRLRAGLGIDDATAERIEDDVAAGR